MWKFEESEDFKWEPGLPGHYKSIFVKSRMTESIFFSSLFPKVLLLLNIWYV